MFHALLFHSTDVAFVEAITDVIHDTKSMW